jgi:hypothetical protein
MSAVIPGDYAQWRHCIVVECGVALTPEYAAHRLAALKLATSEEAQRFKVLYGADHCRRVVSWFEQAAKEASHAA